jgi:hypothetical protein
MKVKLRKRKLPDDDAHTSKHVGVAEQTNKRSEYCIVWPIYVLLLFIIISGSAAQRGLWPPHFTRFLDHTQRHATVGRNPLDE